MDIIYVSHANQFVIADFLAGHYQLDDAQIVLQCSRQNVVELQTQAAQRLTSFPYDALRFLFLPDQPYQLRHGVLKKVDSIFEEFFEKTKPTRVFMFSRERHYSLLIKHARAVKAQIYYVEEGASAYALGQGLLDSDVFSGTRFFHSIRKAVKKNWRDTLLWELLSYPYRCYKCVKAIAGSHDIQLLWLKISRFYPEVFTHNPTFDQAITVYPELAEKSIKADEYLPLPPDFRVQTQKYEELPLEKRFLLLMLNTKGFSLEKMPILYKWLIFILNDIAYRNKAVVEIKPHPADGRGGLLYETIRTLGTKRIMLTDAPSQAISAETLLTQADCRYSAVFAINSTAFLYLTKLRPSLPLFTIGPVLNDFLEKENFPKGALYHGEVFARPEFQTFKNIKAYSLGLKLEF